MRPGQNQHHNSNHKRSRGRGRGGSGGGGGGGGNKPQNILHRNFESTGPDVKIRGNPQHIYEKYLQLARDANSAGDRIMAENYLQHAEHYFRIIAAAQSQMQAANGGHAGNGNGNGNGHQPMANRFQGPDLGSSEDGGENGEAEPLETGPGENEQPIV
jgi:hypothetical protein